MASLWQTFLTNSEFLILKMLLSSYNPDHAQLKDRPKKKKHYQNQFSKSQTPKPTDLLKLRLYF